MVWVLLVEEDAEGGGLDIVELTVTDGPPEGGDADPSQGEGDRYEDVQDDHGVSGCGRRKERWPRAMATTSSDESGMATAATSGVTRPAMAAVAPALL